MYILEKGSGGIYEMYSRFPANIELAKRLLTWSVDKNPHIKDEVFEIENLSQMEFISYKMMILYHGMEKVLIILD